MPEPVDTVWKRKNLWIQTVSGKRFDYHHPDARISITDIAHALSMMCRFGGHIDHFFSVAHHSVLVSQILETTCPQWKLRGLLHDAHEAYLCDIPSPAKWAVNEESDKGYEQLADSIQSAILRKYCQDSWSQTPANDELEYADCIALIMEREALFSVSLEDKLEYREALGVTETDILESGTSVETIIGDGVNDNSEWMSADPFAHGKQAFINCFLELV